MNLPSWPKSLLHVASHSSHMLRTLTSGQEGHLMVGEKGK